MEWQVTLPCQLSMVPVVRRIARGLITDCPRLDDAELIVSELSCNAIRYGGGELTITLAAEEGHVRLTVTDQGLIAPSAEPAQPDEIDDYGRGMAIVNALADRWGHRRDVAGHNTAWAELDW